MIKLDIVGDTTKCGTDCPDYIAKWSAWCAQYERKRLALIWADDHYYNGLDRGSRYMIRKVIDRGYVFHEFNYNDHLQDIYEINTSKAERQGKKMTESYLTYPMAISRELERCETHRYLRIGGFRGGKMYAYCAVAVLNELAILNTIIGHADALTDGIMNGLINHLAEMCASMPNVKYLNYLTMESSGDSLQAFKRSVGFESYQVSFT